jgi:hypothetical protein
MKMKNNQIKLVFLLLTLAAVLLTSSFALAQQAAVAPIPQNAQIVLWMRAGQAAQNPNLKTMLLENNTVSSYLGLMNLDPGKIDKVIMFMPFDKSWFKGTQAAVIPQNLPPNGAFIITGNFDNKNIFQKFKSGGWKEVNYSNKKLMWWSTGASYLLNPKNGECISLLPGGGLAIGGSENIVKSILDVAGGKTSGIAAYNTFQRLSRDFMADNSKLASMFVLVTPEMRNIVMADTAQIKSSTARAALGYVNYLDEVGFSIAQKGSGFLVDAYLGMDSESNALIVSSIFQIGGGLASFLPANDPNRALLESLNISKQGRIVILESNLTGIQLVNLLKHRK